MRRFLVPLIFIVGSSAVPVVAAESVPSVLTLSEVLRRAEAENVSLMARRHHERAAEARVEQAGLRPSPTLDVSAENFGGTGALRGVDALEATVQASQTIERGGKREKRLAVARKEHDSAAAEFAVLRADVLTTAALAYVETLAAQGRLALADESLALSRETVASAEAHAKAGMGSAAELARARAAFAGAKAERAKAENALFHARAVLATAWNGAPDEPISPAGALRLPDELPLAERFLEKLSAHPRLALQAAIISGHRASLDLERAQSVQDVTVGGGVRFLREGRDAAFVAGVSVPLAFRNRNQGNIRAARETLAGAEQQTRAVELELRAAFDAAWREARSSHAIARELRDSALPSAEEAATLVRRAYAAGEAPLIDVIDAQRALLDIRREILDAETACALALVRAESLADTAFPFATSFLSSR